MSVTSVVRKKGVGRQGLQPCTCCEPKQQQQQQPKQKRVSCGVAGRVRLRGTLQVPLRGPAQPPAAVRSGACEAVLRKQSALTHVSSVAASMRLTPPQPDPPRLRQSSAICRHFCRAEPCSAQISQISKYSISIVIHPRMAWITVSTKVDTYQQPPESVRGGAVSECGVSAAWMRLPSLHGRTCGVPALRHHPANPRNARC